MSLRSLQRIFPICPRLEIHNDLVDVGPLAVLTLLIVVPHHRPLHDLDLVPVVHDSRKEDDRDDVVGAFAGPA